MAFSPLLNDCIDHGLWKKQVNLREITKLYTYTQQTNKCFFFTFLTEKTDQKAIDHHYFSKCMDRFRQQCVMCIPSKYNFIILFFTKNGSFWKLKENGNILLSAAICLKYAIICSVLIHDLCYAWFTWSSLPVRLSYLLGVWAVGQNTLKQKYKLFVYDVVLYMPTRGLWHCTTLIIYWFSYQSIYDFMALFQDAKVI